MKRLWILLLACGLLLALALPAAASYEYDYDYEYSYSDEYEEDEEMSLGMKIAVAVGVGLLIGLVTVLVLRAQLKSVRMQAGAANYIRPDSMVVHVSNDIYLYSTVTKIPIPKDNKK